jgi:hypothetical protein
MSDLLRRYEVLLPLNYNDRTPVPAELLHRTREEFEQQFGAISSETQAIRGFDRSTKSEGDKLVRMFLDVPDTAENRAYFQAAKERLKARFQQVEIWITTYPVETL